ncbi:45808_t:CDS:1, partial [Gigaspora margarita]
TVPVSDYKKCMTKTENRKKKRRTNNILNTTSAKTNESIIDMKQNITETPTTHIQKQAENRKSSSSLQI